VVSIGAEAWKGPDLLFEGHEIVDRAGTDFYGDPERVHSLLTALVASPIIAEARGEELRQRAVDLFSVDVVGPQWQAFLG